VLVFDARIAWQDPAVPETGGAAMLLYCTIHSFPRCRSARVIIAEDLIEFCNGGPRALSLRRPRYAS
jgi:hypothetical protein